MRNRRDQRSAAEIRHTCEHRFVRRSVPEHGLLGYDTQNKQGDNETMAVTTSERLRERLASNELLRMPCCFDGLSARVIAQAGFEVAFVSGFAISGTRLGLPDTGLMSFGEIRDQVRDICGAIPGVPVIVDGDTGHGNAINARRTITEFARAGAACVMIEDQVSPKRCGHTQGKAVVDFREARQRIRAAIDAARDSGLLILARTDARAVEGFDKALDRCRMFEEEGADIVFLEAPESIDEMERACAAIRKPMMANMVRGGKTPFLPADHLSRIGYRLVVYPMVPLASALHAMQQAVLALRDDAVSAPPEASFDTIKRVVGFPDYYALEERYRWSEPS